jgi:hypothetical protein
MTKRPLIERAVAEGNSFFVDFAAQISKSQQKSFQPTFMRMFVLEVISDPHSITQEKVDYWKKVLGVGEHITAMYADVLPRNSIIAQGMLDGNSQLSIPMFLLPFFPSHLSLPCKPGEMVWAMYENPNADVREIGYWFCKVSQPHYIDDVNHTHQPSLFDESLTVGTYEKSKGKVNITRELRNGKVSVDAETTQRFVQYKSRVLDHDDDVFEKLITTTDASQIIQYESVPRFRKRPGDISLEGSNNTLIVLGTDRKNVIADYIENETKGKVPFISKDLVGSAGSIDIVAGRGTLPETSGKVAGTQQILTGEELKKELDKQSLVENEGDPDLINDRSRVLVSQKTLPDGNFGISEYLSKKNEVSDSSEGDAAVVIKSDKIRIIARSDISLIVTDWKPGKNDQTGSAFKSDETDQTKWASITIKRNGDIIFTPSEKGYIKLGGNEADKALLCTDQPAIAQEGKVSAPPLTTLGADPYATGATGTGTFATKILVK